MIFPGDVRITSLQGDPERPNYVKGPALASDAEVGVKQLARRRYPGAGVQLWYQETLHRARSLS